MKKEVYELTNPQKSIFYTEEFTNKPINNIVGIMYFKNDIDIGLLKDAVNLTIKNNQAMNTRIVSNSSTPMQYFANFSPFEIEVYDFSNNTMKDFESFKLGFSQKMFDFYESPLFEFVICKLPSKEIALIGKFHHIIVDAWSLGLVIDRIAFFYTKLLTNSEISEDFGNYIDFIKREEEYISSELYKKNKNFWENTIKNIEPVRLKSATSSFKANRKYYELTEQETSLINDFCKQNRISPYAFFLAVLNIYLYRTTSLENFSIQTPLLNRLGKEKGTIGMFINMISIPFSNNGNLQVKDLLHNISSDSLSFFKNGKYPYMHLLNDLRKNNSTKTCNIVYSFQNMRAKTIFQDIVSYRSEWSFVGYMQDEFVVNVTDINNSGRYTLSYDYLVDLFSDTEIDLIHKRLKTIISNILSNPNTLISKIEILPEEEKELILNSFNNTDFPYDKEKTLIDLFEENVAKNPSDIALVYKEKTYTYFELNNMANIIAEELEKHDITNSRVAVLCKKSAWMVASLLGIMKSGNCYIPIDGTYPEDRIKYIIDNSKCSMIITSEEYKNLYDLENKIILENLDFTLTLHYKSKATPNDLAYMIYTSGTTGNPKGVKIKHKNIINTLIWRKNCYNFSKDDVVLQVPSFSFDSSVEDIFTPLISGSMLVIPAVTRMDVNILAEELARYKVNHFLVVPSLYKILLHEKLDCLSNMKIITIAGESFPMSLVKEHFKKLPNVRLINEYGPTENSVCSTFYELTEKDESILIGKPINNCKCYVLDKNLELLPLYTKGELYVSGPGVSEGYWNKPDLTKERFLDNPFDPNYKMYKTGDIVLQNSDGNLEFIGRDDGQVKFHGLRIELKEIEKNILKNEDISDAIVLVKELSSKKQLLVAYVTSYKTDFDINLLYENLRNTLPFYMLPTIVKLDSFPLTPNGKIDKSKLPLPVTKKSSNVLPRNELENDILIICREVLENSTLGIYDDFFTDGNADSLNILTINSRLFANGIKVNTQDFYQNPTVESLAKYISKNKEKVYTNNNFIQNPKTTVFPEGLDANQLKFEYKNVLLTGATGFLGIHILDYLLKNTDCIIYCIIREKYNQTPQKRLENLLQFYFNSDYYSLYKNRIIVLNGELSKDFFSLSQEQYSNLQKNIDCIINTAANTKHYGNYATFERENVDTVRNLIAFAKPTGILLNHMSTTNVSGNYLVDNNISYDFTENDFYIGQNYQDNVYIRSKFEAEKLIIEEEFKGLKANIFRLGNLMARYNDGAFQKNKMDNAYYTRLIALAKLGVLPDSLKNQTLEFSPIDETAKAIVKLLTIPNIENNIFHIFSNKLISIELLLRIFEDYNCTCKFTNYDDFIENLHLQKNDKVLKYIISDLNNAKQFDYSSDIVINQQLTNKFLDFVGFEWSMIDENYLKRFFDKVNFTKDIEI